MAIVQISKIQQRSGNLVDLPQLSEAEFGFATDEKRLFIGKTSDGIENIEVLTSYSNVDFNQINGGYGNLDISIDANTAAGANGQVLAFDGNNWVNRGGNAGGLLTLGFVSNVKITGGAIDYVLTTDGTGNLSWTPKSTILANIQNVESLALDLNSTFATASDSATDLITVASTTGYSVNTAVVFSGTSFGSITAGNTYYVTEVNPGNTTIAISSTQGGGNVTLTTDTGNMTLKVIGTVVTTAQDNFFTDGIEATITSAMGMTELNGFSYYLDVLSSNTFALYTDPAFANAVDSTNYTPYAYTSVTATTASTNIITVGDSNSFAQFDPVIFIGTTFGNITANETYYISNIVSFTEIKIATSDDGNASNIVTLTTASGTANVYSPGGRVIATVGGGSGSSNAGGTQYSVQYNNSNLLDGDANFTYDFANRLLTISGGNANLGNINATALISASRFASNIATGTQPITVDSTTRVSNLNVSYSNVTDYSVVTAQTTGTFYPVFVSSSSTSNQALGVNSALSFNVLSSNLSLTGNLSVTANITSGNINAGNLLTANFVTGVLTVASNAQSNLTSFGNGTQVTVAGNLNPNADVTYNLGNSTNRWNDLYLSGSTVYLGNATITSNASGVVITNASGGTFTVGGASAANSAAIVNGNSNVVVTANSNVNISSNGIANVLVVTNTGANVSGTGNITGNANVGNLGTAGLVVATGNITGGNLVTSGALSVTGNANTGNLGTQLVIATGNISATQFISNISTGAAPLIVTSTTKVANLNVDSVDGYDTSISTSANTIVVRNADGNIAGNNISGTISTAAQPNITSLGTLTSLGVNGTITGVSVTANTGVFTGNGSGLSSLAAANITGQVANALVAGTVYTNAQPNITSVGTLSSLSVTANTTTGGIKTDNYYYANGVSISFAGTYSNSNVASYLPTFTGTIGSGAATHYGTTLTTGANTTAGTITGNWTLSTGSRLQATYADLAEYYRSDINYEPGTVLEFGGQEELTLAQDATSKVAGVVTTNPAYVMNSSCEGKHVVAIALQGRVPCKVRGTINKGDMLISGGNGFARPSQHPAIGTVIGKALQNFDGVEGVIEVAVGRL